MIWIGWMAIYTGIFSGFASSQREFEQVWLRVVIPCAASALTGGALAAASVIALVRG